MAELSRTTYNGKPGYIAYFDEAMRMCDAGDAVAAKFVADDGWRGFFTVDEPTALSEWNEDDHPRDDDGQFESDDSDDSSDDDDSGIKIPAHKLERVPASEKFTNLDKED